MTHAAYVGRFAPSPTGALHAGSVTAALASWLDARARGGRWLVRMEDVDTPRCVAGADRFILQQLDALGLQPDEPVLWQSRRQDHYAATLQRLIAQGHAYACICTRADIERSNAQLGRARGRHGERVYPGTCRNSGNPSPGAAHAWRLRVPHGSAAQVHWHDRRLGPQSQQLDEEVGDFVLQRSDGLWAYQLAVVVDDAEQGITHVVRGEDLADNTPRQLWLQRCLAWPAPQYLHVPLVLGNNGEKLSKQNGATAVDTGNPLVALREAGRRLGVDGDAADAQEWLAQALARWAWQYPQ